MRLFVEFAYLQLLDILTTAAFLVLGVTEANPLVIWAVNVASDPMIGLAAIKIGALGLGAFCILRSREKLLRRVNIFFAILVANNMLAIVMATRALPN